MKKLMIGLVLISACGGTPESTSETAPKPVITAPTTTTTAADWPNIHLYITDVDGTVEMVNSMIDVWADNGLRAREGSLTITELVASTYIILETMDAKIQYFSDMTPPKDMEVAHGHILAWLIGLRGGFALTMEALEEGNVTKANNADQMFREAFLELDIALALLPEGDEFASLAP